MTGQVRLGVVMLCHQALHRAAAAARIWVEGGAAVAVHVDAGASADEAAAMHAALADLPGVRMTARRRCRWGHFSLVAATQAAAADLLAARPDLTHVLLVSGSCLPLRPVDEFCAFLSASPGCDHIESVSARDAAWPIGGLGIERFTLFFPFDWRRQRRLFDQAVRVQRRLGVGRRFPAGISPHLGSQWWCLTTPTLRAILTDPRRSEFERYFRRCWLPDESYFQTLVRRHSARIDSRSPVLSRFDHAGRPHVLHDDHLEMLQASRAFIARKAWPGAEALYRHFPRPADPVGALPDPAALVRAADAAALRARDGRKGLYMQSRFPRKDAGRHKTAAPYVVLCGLTGPMPDIPDWLAARLDADVHGHLFAADEIAFAGRPAIAPGALTTSPALRDADPRGFLAALVRGGARQQVFQFGPGDSQALLWFMATDPNARIVLLAGGWAAPLPDCGMPFDDIRRAFRRLQGVERQQIEVLTSVWRRADLLRLDLADLAADPGATLTRILRFIDPAGAAATDLPAMRPLHGLPALLDRLRAAGVPPDIALMPRTDPDA